MAVLVRDDRRVEGPRVRERGGRVRPRPRAAGHVEAVVAGAGSRTGDVGGERAARALRVVAVDLENAGRGPGGHCAAGVGERRADGPDALEGAALDRDDAAGYREARARVWQ